MDFTERGDISEYIYIETRYDLIQRAGVYYQGGGEHELRRNVKLSNLRIPSNSATALQRNVT